MVKSAISTVIYYLKSHKVHTAQISLIKTLKLLLVQMLCNAFSLVFSGLGHWHFYVFEKSGCAKISIFILSKWNFKLLELGDALAKFIT